MHLYLSDCKGYNTISLEWNLTMNKKKRSSKAKKYGLIGALIASLVGLIPSLFLGYNDHPIEEVAEEIIKSGVCLGSCDNIEIDLSPGASGFFSEDDSVVLPPEASRKILEAPHLPPLPKPRGENLNPGEPLPRPHDKDNNQ